MENRELRIAIYLRTSEVKMTAIRQQNYLTTKTTKVTKGSDTYYPKLRVLRGESCPFFFGCGSATLGLFGRIASLILLVLLFGLSADVFGQEKYPDRPITIVAPFPPGGVADLTARPVAAAMEKVLKNPVVVVNKTGAAGAVGKSFVANS